MNQKQFLISIYIYAIINYILIFQLLEVKLSYLKFNSFGIEEEIMSLSQLLDVLPKLPAAHKTAHRMSSRVAKYFSTMKDVEPHHPPSLMDFEPTSIHE